MKAKAIDEEKSDRKKQMRRENKARKRHPADEMLLRVKNENHTGSHTLCERSCTKCTRESVRHRHGIFVPHPTRIRCIEEVQVFVFCLHAHEQAPRVVASFRLYSTHHGNRRLEYGLSSYRIRRRIVPVRYIVGSGCREPVPMNIDVQIMVRPIVVIDEVVPDVHLFEQSVILVQARVRTDSLKTVE